MHRLTGDEAFLEESVPSGAPPFLPLPRFHKSDLWLRHVAGRMRDRVSRPRYNDRI